VLKRIPTESWPGIALILSAAAAMIIVNSPLGADYQALLYSKLSVGAGAGAIEMPLSGWIKNALMAVFFFYAGMELKREMLEGALSTRSGALLPMFGAAGGMALPAIIYLALAPAYPTGWAIPAATDIAFALGVLALLGPRVPPALKAFLLAVAVVDDLGAILIVAFVYTAGISYLWLGIAAAFFAALVLVNRAGVASVWPYLLFGLPLWMAMQNSGVNPTIAGVLVAACLPLKTLHGVEHGIRPYVLFGVMPVFALANAGAELGSGLAAAVTHPVAIAVAAGLAIGKPVGITLVAFVAAKAMKAALPGRVIELIGVGCIAGIGFTMSLFIGALAFADPALQTPVRMGVYIGSLASAVLGLVILASVLKPRVAAPGEEDPTHPFIADDHKR
jgi:NhaA family Na+:H+ antiporter